MVAMLTVKQCEEIGHAFKESLTSTPRVLKAIGFADDGDSLLVAKHTRVCRYWGLVQHCDEPIRGPWLSPSEYEAKTERLASGRPM